MKFYATTCIALTLTGAQIVESCGFPDYLHGEWYYMVMGYGKSVNISRTTWGSNFYCLELYNHTKMAPDAKIVNHTYLLESRDEGDNCLYCVDVLWRTPNVLQFHKGDCILQSRGMKVGDCPGVSRIIDVSQMTTMFRIDSPVNVSCIEPFGGTYQFTYEVNYGGGGVCDNKSSLFLPYEGDDRLFQMHYEQCPDVTTSMTKDVLYQCYGRWEVFNQYVLNEYAVIADVNEQDFREKFKCLMTTKNQRDYYGKERWVMSRFVDCSNLRSGYDGPVKLVLKPVCAYDLQRDRSYHECMNTYDAFFKNIMEFSYSPIYTNPDLLQSLCSVEGRAASHCVVETIEKCPELSKGFKNYFGFDVLDIVNMGGLNQTCSIFFESCSNVADCFSNGKLESLHKDLSTLDITSNMNHSTALKQSEILCGPLKSMYECITTKLTPCNVGKDKVMMLVQYYGSTKDFTVDKTSTNFITEKCENVKNINNACVTSKLATKEFSDCLIRSVNITDACSMHKKYTACISDIISSDCGEKSASFVRDALVAFELDVPESCLKDTSFANRNTALSLYILSLMSVLLFTIVS